MSPKVPVVSIVACLMPEMGIGHQGKLPWKLKQEMAYFRQVTTGTFNSDRRNAVVMGRKTWESIPPKFRPLPGRVNVIVSRDHAHGLAPATESSDHVWQSNSLAKCLELLPQLVGDLERIFVIGGGEVYAQTMLLNDYMLMTEIRPEDGTEQPPMDTFLDRGKISQLYQRNDDVAGFLPSNVQLPNVPQIREKGYVYEFALYKRRPEA
ncbi:LADA_0C07272g1_1 [Lachancea dasiensis]|uniref:Dihydrofolate reductase n=1 Tax=Lachancea dasiensis TaxID=1072105 RepID=A0A1G4J071_9SACH|nr:LADA_0C07272g1_1 [Lachancea dasiensis]